MRGILVAVAGLLLSACANESPVPEGAPKALGAMAERSALPSAKQTEDFGALADFVGMKLVGTPTATSDEPLTDVQSWEWALGGKAILIRHALEDGSYGGDTYIYKDAKTGKLTYVYITNAGFHTVGEMTTTGAGWVAEEAVIGHPEITRVRSTSVIHDGKSTRMASEYLKGGAWVPGHEFEYRPTSGPLPALKSD